MIVLLLVAGLAYYWLLVNAGPAGIPARPLDLAAMRKAALAMPGSRPESISFKVLARRQIPGAALAAGTGLRQIDVGVIAWRLNRPDGGIVIDPGLSQTDAAAIGFKHYDRAARAVVDKWLEQSRLILFTHLHVDHVGLFLDHPAFDSIAGKAVVTPTMLNGISALWRENGGRIAQTRSLGPVEAVAPGVVLVQTPGHTPGSEMVFVKLADGREFLFAGDTASLGVNADRPTPRSRLLAEWLAPEDRPAVIGWLKGLKALRTRNPKVVIVPSHDLAWTFGNQKLFAKDK